MLGAVLGFGSMLLSIRPSFHRKTQVLYKAPGFLAGTYMLEKQGRISKADLVDHAILMRYGHDVVMIGDDQLKAAVALHIEIVEVN